MAAEIARQQASPEVVFGADSIPDDEPNLLATIKIVGCVGTGANDAHAERRQQREAASA